MDVVFAKATPAPAHHYSRLLKRNSKPEQPVSEDFFAAKPPSSPHLYTPRGLAKGHRRTNSELPIESLRPANLLSKTTEKSHFDLSAELTSTIHDQLESLVSELDSTQRKELTELIEKLQTETQAAKAEAASRRQEAEAIRQAIKESEGRKMQAEQKADQLEIQVALLDQENNEFEVRLSEDPRLVREFRDSLSLSLERELASGTVATLQAEIRDKTAENERLQRTLNEALRELRTAKTRTRA
jgi:hypothetical protein